MADVPKRKPILLQDFDYSTSGAYFITICTANRHPFFWDAVSTRRTARRGELCSPTNVPLSGIGRIVDAEFIKLNHIYPSVTVDKYCIMLDHIHIIIAIHDDATGRTQFAPTISRIIKQFKGSITKQVGQVIWQKGFYDHCIRNQQDYNEIWEYIENNPQKYAQTRMP